MALVSETSAPQHAVPVLAPCPFHRRSFLAAPAPHLLLRAPSSLSLSISPRPARTHRRLSQHHTTRSEAASLFSPISLQRTTSCVRRPPYVQRARCASGGWSSEERRSPSTATACPAMYTTTAACSPTRVPLCTHHHPLLATIRADRQQQQRRPVSQRSVPSHRVPA